MNSRPGFAPGYLSNFAEINAITSGSDDLFAPAGFVPLHVPIHSIVESVALIKNATSAAESVEKILPHSEPALGVNVMNSVSSNGRHTIDLSIKNLLRGGIFLEELSIADGISEDLKNSLQQPVAKLIHQNFGVQTPGSKSDVVYPFLLSPEREEQFAMHIEPLLKEENGSQKLRRYAKVKLTYAPLNEAESRHLEITFRIGPAFVSRGPRLGGGF